MLERPQLDLSNQSQNHQRYKMFWKEQRQDQNFVFRLQGQQKPKRWVLQNMAAYFARKLHRDLPSCYLNKFSLISEQDADRIMYSKIVQKWAKHNSFDIEQLMLKPDELRGLGCMMGLAIGDALGASTEFEPFDKKRQYWIPNDFKDLQKCVEKGILSERHGEMGIWTDDCSMAIAMSDSLLLNNYKFVPKNIRYMFVLWLKQGLGNGGRAHSIGLGGNISMSMYQFMQEQNDYTLEGDILTSGNGSLMRLAPVPIAFRQNEEEAMENSALQSCTTHQGHQARECCRLLALIIVRLINRSEGQKWEQVLEKACRDFKTDVPSVQHLARSEKQPEELYEECCKKWKEFYGSNKSVQDRNWNWKSPQFTYSVFRADRQPEYIGSYCMDALSMALHIVWQKKTFKEAVLWAINMGGDCDTVGAIAGQIAGAAHGFGPQMFHLYSQMQDFNSQRYQILLKGIKLSTKRQANQLQPLSHRILNEQNQSTKQTVANLQNSVPLAKKLSKKSSTCSKE